MMEGKCNSAAIVFYNLLPIESIILEFHGKSQALLLRVDVDFPTTADQYEQIYQLIFKRFEN